MKIYKTQQEVEEDIKDEVLTIDGDVKFECPISIEASIVIDGDINASDINASDINANDINAGDINAWNIKARNIDASDINANDINAGDINAWNIKARNIKARNIDAGDINANDINAGDISYHALCLSYNSIECTSIEARREKHQKPICLEGRLKIKEKIKEMTVAEVSKELGYDVAIVK